MELDYLKPLRGEKVAIVGFSETRSQAPWDDESWEIWVCNRLPLQEGVTRWDRHFDPHTTEWSKQNFVSPELWTEYEEEFLKKDHGKEKLIYLPPEDEERYPNSVKWPQNECIEYFGREYFTSAIAWQIGFAQVLGVKELGLFGIDLRHDTEWADQRPNAEWLLGIAEGHGIKINLPVESSLLNQDQHAELYGLEIHAGVYGEFEKRIKTDLDATNKAMAEMEEKRKQLEVQMHTDNGARQVLQGYLDRVRQRRRGGGIL